jgi:hypothetical protein
MIWDKYEITEIIFTRHFLQAVFEFAKHMSTDACLKVKSTEDGLQVLSTWKED